MPGAHLQSSDVQPLIINQPVGFKVKSDEHALELKDELASWLITDDPVELQFDDEPGRTYFAIVQNTIDDFEKIVSLRQGTIQFLCLNPYGYGLEEQANLSGHGSIIEVGGTAEAKPIFELEVTEPTTYIMVANDKNDYMMIGEPVDIVEKPFTKYERIFYSDGNNLTGWATANSGEIDGVVSGTMGTNGTRFQASSYGTGAGWHGPAIKQSLSENLKDFRLEAFIALYNKNVPGYVGRVSVGLLDANGKQITKLEMKDTRNGQALGWGEARSGDSNKNHYLISEAGDNPGNWNNFYGIVRIERENNVWKAYFAMVGPATGRHHTRRQVSWTDTEGLFSWEVAQVVVHVGQYGAHPVPAHGVYSISVFKINQQSDAIPYIAQPGDVVTFDHRGMGELLINGESFKHRKDFGGRYFKLKPGQNTLALMPDGVSGIVKWRDAFK